MWTHNMCSVHLLPSSLEVVILKLFGLRTSAHFLTLLRISRELLLTWIISNDIYHAMLCLVSRWCPTLWDSIICSPPGSSVHGILQARILKWVALPSFRGSSQPRDRIHVSPLQVDSLLFEPPEKPKNTGEGSLSLLQGIFLTQELNRGLLNCRRILYQLSYREALIFIILSVKLRNFHNLISNQDNKLYLLLVMFLIHRLKISDLFILYINKIYTLFIYKFQIYLF